MAGTIKEVAKLAGVSYQAVSAVLNGNLGKASPATRERIFAAADQLHYRPNRMARGLVSGRTGLIGFVTQDIRSPYYADLDYEIQTEADRRGLQLLMMNSNWDDEQTLRQLGRITTYAVDGLILLSNVLPAARKRGIVAPETPVVLIDNLPTSYSSLGFDYLPGMRAAFRFLTGTGHRRITFVHDPVDTPKSGAYFRLCGEFGLAPAELHYRYPTVGGEAPLVELGEQIGRGPLPDALLIAADHDAALILQGLRRAGIRVPEELSILSIDDTLAGRITAPPLTTIRLDRARLARLTFDRLCSLLETPGTPPYHQSLPTELVVRHSVAPRR